MKFKGRLGTVLPDQRKTKTQQNATHYSELDATTREGIIETISKP